MSNTSTDTPSTDAGDTVETSDDSDGGFRVRRYANYAVLLVLGVLALVAVIRLYFSVSNVITTWVASEYRSLFQAAFNLVVLLATGLGISYQLRRLYG
ncbi:hypothetical protein [Haloplanus sp.]|uniref:hypothetical protein n=1 Tax=Haloplanus sp. TaxID=1961696 RepID=UPI002604C04F|nr:hypothetical protein [Haloplanus sp.]